MIIDCVLFFEELELLELRFSILDPYVDKFMVIEASQTFQGQEKPLIFQRNAGRFTRFWDKIIHVPVRDMPDSNCTWDREHHQRNAISRGIYKSWPSDTIIMMSDTDEIPDMELWVHGPKEIPTTWSHNFYYYYVDLQIDVPITGTVATTLADFQGRLQSNGQLLRECRHDHRHVLRGGWHFSYLGGAERIQRKIRAFAHNELLSHSNTANIEHSIMERWKSGVDLFNRNLYKFRPVDDVSTLPKYLVDNRDKYPQFWLPRTAL